MHEELHISTQHKEDLPVKAHSHCVPLSPPGLQPEAGVPHFPVGPVTSLIQLQVCLLQDFICVCLYLYLNVYTVAS